jgi:membrane-bound serine protease (ClpP class)
LPCAEGVRSVGKFKQCRYLLIEVLLLLFLLSPAACGAPNQTVFIANIDGVIGVPLESFMDIVFKKVSEEYDPVLILKINTPGGLVDSMSQIASDISGAPFPVVAWVAPSGSHAASAGAFIVEISHLAAMAEGTNMGAAHPVAVNGKDAGGELSRKAANDLAAKMRAFASQRGRNAAAAESMVTKSVSFTAREALEKKLIDLTASDLDELLKAIDGRTVNAGGRSVTLRTAGAAVEEIEMPVRLRILELLSRPDIAYMTLLAGILLIFLEFRAPGGYILGAAGVVFLLSASYGLRVLPVNLAGVLLLIAGIGIILTDLLIGGIGVISAAGIGAMLFGGLIMFKAPGGELLRVSPFFMAVSTAVVGAVFLLVLALIYRALRSRPTSGKEGMVGGRGEVCGESAGKSVAMIFGEYWTVVPDDPNEKLSEGDLVEVVRVKSLVLYVKKVAGDNSSGGAVKG